MADNIKIDLLINAAESAKTIQETKKALRDLKTEAMNLTEGTAAFTKVATAAGQLQDKIGDLSATTKYLGDDLRNIKAISGIGQGIAAGFAIATGAAALFGDENKKLQESMVKLQAIMAVMQGMEQIGAVLQKESAAMLGIKNAVTKTAIFLTSEQAAAEAAEAVAAGTATVAQRALNAAMNANPIGILITLILAGVAALTLWGGKSDAAAAAEKKANEEKKRSIALLKAQKEEQDKKNEYVAKELTGYLLLTEQLKKTNPNSAERLRLIKEINGTYGTTLKNLKDEKEFQKQAGDAVLEYITMLKLKYKVQSNETLIADNLKKQYTLEAELAKAQADLNKSIEARKQAGYKDTGRDLRIALELQYEVVDKLTSQLKTAQSRLVAYTTSTLDANEKLNASTIHTAETVKEADKTVVKSNDDKNKAIEEANIKALETAAKIRELYDKGITDAEDIRIALMKDGYEKEAALLRREEKKQADEVANGAIEIYKILEQAEIEKLKLAKTYISDNKDSRFKAQQDEIKDRVVSNQQLIDLDLVNGKTLNLIREDFAKKHVELNSKYLGTDLMKVIQDNADYEQSILNEKYKKSEISGAEFLKSTEKLVNDVQSIQDEFNKNPENVINALGKVDGNNYDIILTSVDKQATTVKEKEKKTAEELIKIDTEKNKKIAENQVKANDEIDAIITNHDLAVAEEEKRKAEMKIQAYVDLEQQLQAAALSIFNNAMDQRSKANQKEYDDKIALIDAEQQAYENAQANRTTLQQAQYDTEQGFAEQKKNAERVRQLEEDKIKKKQFNAQKINDAATVAIKTAMAVMGAVQAFPLTGGMPFTAINIAIGAIEEAAILSKKYIPTYATGGLVMGAGTGTSDSIDARLSNGESVINAKSTSMFAPMLSAINQAGGGVAIPHTKNSIFNPNVSTSGGLDTDGIINAINELNNRPIETYVKEVAVTNSQNRADKLKRRTSF
jgi:hypothetical protein